MLGAEAPLLPEPKTKGAEPEAGVDPNANVVGFEASMLNGDAPLVPLMPEFPLTVAAAGVAGAPKPKADAGASDNVGGLNAPKDEAVPPNGFGMAALSVAGDSKGDGDAVEVAVWAPKPPNGLPAGFGASDGADGAPKPPNPEVAGAVADEKVEAVAPNGDVDVEVELTDGSAGLPHVKAAGAAEAVGAPKGDLTDSGAPKGDLGAAAVPKGDLAGSACLSLAADVAPNEKGVLLGACQIKRQITWPPERIENLTSVELVPNPLTIPLDVGLSALADFSMLAEVDGATSAAGLILKKLGG